MQVVSSSKMSKFFPNSCFVCQSTKALKRCSYCNMVSYCGTEHQKKHWPEHKEFCKEIWIMIKEQGVTHLYENLQGLDLQSWRLQRDLLIDEVEGSLGREVTSYELDILMFPRVCFVCHDARQELLNNCPGCPSANFCNNHPNSTTHALDCRKMQKIHEMFLQVDSTSQLILMEVIVPIITKIQIDESFNLPLSMEDFLDLYAQSEMDFSENELIFISDHCDEPLTVFNALKKLNYSDSEIIIHVEGMRSSTKTIDTSGYWEVLFHLLPNLRKIKIVFVEVDFVRNMEIILCKNCHLKKKFLSVEANTLPYLEYMKREDYEKPSILVFFNLPVETIVDNDFLIYFQLKLARCSALNCPLILTTNRKTDYISLRKILRSSLGVFITYYEGLNKFRSLSYLRYWDGRLCLQNNFLILIDPQKTRNCSLGSFYAAHCPICFSENASVKCESCKMIFYCGSAHRNKDLLYHRDLCKVISNILYESGIRNMFNQLSTPNSEKWLKVKIDLMLEVEMKLGRELLDYEKQMFLFPKTCFVCHESDLDLLRNCECGVSLCNSHENDFRHKQLCEDFFLAFKLSMIEELPGLKLCIKVKPDLPCSMNEFLDSFFQFQKGNTDLQKIFLSNLYTRPLTLFYVLEEELNLKIDSIMVVHVIGAVGMEVGTCASWMLMFYLLNHLQILKIVFIGPNVFRTHSSLDNFFNDADCPVGQDGSLKVECHALTYDEYCLSDSFVHPNIVVGYNLNLHESELGISKCTWKDTIFTLEELEVPFVLTAGTEDRARKDHRSLCELLGKSVDYLSLKQNPFGGLIPERDFESEELLYSNQHVIIYDGFYENLRRKEDNFSDSQVFECLVN